MEQPLRIVARAMQNRYARYHILAERARSDIDLARTGRLVAAMFMLVGICDALSTNWALSHGAFEINGAMRWLQDTLGPLWFVPKAFAHALVAAMIVWSPNRLVLSIMSVMTVVTAMVVANNVQIATMLAA
ncbi:DUF5658 family protein [Neomegalonema perideroedes]|uniref:DUF5658 family protein n=1 Tax=Neomegalonema perideroedes TaxID=217219 RepID=UPI00037A00F6|nr:DUF5658 family protein [Neomegalonema perideroedes]